MNSWSLAKVALVFVGVSLVLTADRFAMPLLAWVGLGLVLAAFFLRFWQRAKAHPRNGTAPPP